MGVLATSAVWAQGRGGNGGILFTSADWKASASFGAVEADKRAGSRRKPLRQNRGDTGAQVTREGWPGKVGWMRGKPGPRDGTNPSSPRRLYPLG